MPLPSRVHAVRITWPKISRAATLAATVRQVAYAEVIPAEVRLTATFSGQADNCLTGDHVKVTPLAGYWAQQTVTTRHIAV